MSKTAKSFIIISIVWTILLAMSAIFAGTNENIPHRFAGTYASDTVTLTFSGEVDVTAVCGDKTVTGTYMNGTTGTKLVVWMDFGEDCPEEFQYLVGDRENYLVYMVGDDYLEIDGVKYYKK